ncbi:hypothetical protein DdX_13407 [Ditylenchus destructor]|uniref:Uncharacterized protein n=1 Tax=Ditylenchus destructor TaxID=166010 RepID=A0AAD4QZJ5_9BILA|nr:hypothetical protein DdX_13407 [Ditylenchus destructor]
MCSLQIQYFCVPKRKLLKLNSQGIKAKNFINPSLSSSPASLVLSLRSLNRYLSTPKLRQVKQQWALLSFCSWLWQSLLVLHINSAIDLKKWPFLSKMCKNAASSSRTTMGAAVVLLLAVAIAAGAAYQLGYLDIYIEQAKLKINEAQSKQQ